MDISGVGTAASALSSGREKTFGKEEFLKLLVTQLKNQDPVSPVDNADFLAQMAQFTSLEQLQNLNASMEKLVDFQESLAIKDNFFSFAAMLGKNVEACNPETGELLAGKVQGYYLDSGEVVLQLAETKIPAAWVYLVGLEETK